MLCLPASLERVARVACDLRDDILRARLRAGDRLACERDRVECIGVNLGAVRVRLRALAQLGPIEVAASMLPQRWVLGEGAT